MEQVNAMQLRDPDIVPDDAVLQPILGKSFATYRRLLDLFDANALTHEWRYYRDGNAWLCKVQKTTKTIVWMSVWDGYVKATVYVPEKHAEGIFDLDIPDAEKAKIKDIKNVGKSQPCTFDITDDETLAAFEKVMRYKLDLPR